MQDEAVRSELRSDEVEEEICTVKESLREKFWRGWLEEREVVL